MKTTVGLSKDFDDLLSIMTNFSMDEMVYGQFGWFGRRMGLDIKDPTSMTFSGPTKCENLIQ